MKATANELAKNEAVKMNAPNVFRILKGPILKGLCPSAQGCEERATLGDDDGVNSTLKGLRRCLAVLEVEKTWRRNPFRVGKVRGRFPRVARSSQPWALSRNLF